METVIATKGLCKNFGEGELQIKALKDVDLSIVRGEFTAIVGPSGSGKTTLLNILCGLDVPSSGEIRVSGKPLSTLNGSELARFRRDHIGLVFQAYNLIPVLTVMENIEYVMLLQGISAKERKNRVLEFLQRIGLEGKEKRFPAELSGGQQQRVAIARAMVSQPDLILADEPTANLDSETGIQLLEMMRNFNRVQQMTFIFSTHDPMIMERASRLITLTDGRIVEDEQRD
jgi:putative ABC transport system ATP-binding protein